MVHTALHGYRDDPLIIYILLIYDDPRREKLNRLDHRVRKRADSNIVQRHATRGDTPVNQASNAIFDEVLGTINAAIRDPISVTEVILDVRSSSVRLNHPGAH